jgi:hypothetical protein
MLLNAQQKRQHRALFSAHGAFYPGEQSSFAPGLQHPAFQTAKAPRNAFEKGEGAAPVHICAG